MQQSRKLVVEIADPRKAANRRAGMVPQSISQGGNGDVGRLEISVVFLSPMELTAVLSIDTIGSN